MLLEEYVEKARTTVIYPNKGRNLAYTVLGLIEEAGELREKVRSSDHPGAALEAGDLAWYLNATCDELGLPMANLFTAQKPDGTSAYSASGRILEQAAKVGGVVKKAIRDDAGIPNLSKVVKITEGLMVIAVDLQEVVAALDLTMSEVWELNINKLFSRKERNVISGSGDHR